MGVNISGEKIFGTSLFLRRTPFPFLPLFTQEGVRTQVRLGWEREGILLFLPDSSDRLGSG
jgi:hypothetical protein